MKEFMPDYNNLIMVARNIVPERTPLYEHHISVRTMEQIMNKEFSQLYYGGTKEKQEFFLWYCEFFRRMGYDTVSFELGISTILPGGGALLHKPGVIKTMEDFRRYPWESLTDIYFEKCTIDFEAFRSIMPDGMKAVGGPGNGVFEIVQDLVGYMDLCYISADDPELYSLLFKKVGEVMHAVWSKFLELYGDIYAVCRFGDDLGFKNTTLISVNDIRKHIIPIYKDIIRLVHDNAKPFLLHSCGNIFDVMDDLIDFAGIDAKHSNEDVIAPFSIWVERYGDRIGNFGGVDVDILCNSNEAEIKSYVREIMAQTEGHGGIALGSGNSIPDYVPVESYIAMVESVREIRGGI